MAKKKTAKQERASKPVKRKVAKRKAAKHKIVRKSVKDSAQTQPVPSKTNKRDDPKVKELENRFWTYFWIIKSFITVIIFILLFIFVRRLILLMKGM